jgi:hypothetical protein
MIAVYAAVKKVDSIDPNATKQTIIRAIEYVQNKRKE